ncbi:MAG: redoxin domain-containing protein, partial [Verrucomicrobiota bacterium]
VKTTSKEAQKFINQGIGQLHGFWDFEAERSFRQAAALDPDCAMAYWGMAQANFKNDVRGKGFAEEAKNRMGSVGEVEKRWIESIAAYFSNTKLDKKKRLRDYVKALERMAESYPDNIEVKAFLLKQIYYNHRNGVPISSHYAVNLLGREILALDANHPAHHYIIHLWDREKADNALKSAALLGQTAPGIAHMWHMPGHIYDKLKRYDDAAWHQEASARIDHAHMMKYQLIPDQIYNFAHNNEWFTRNCQMLGRYDDAVDLAKNMIELPRLPKFAKPEDKKAAKGYNPGGSSWQLGRQRLRDTLVRFEQWDELLRLADTDYLRPDGKAIKAEELNRFLAIAHYETDNAEAGDAILAEVKTLLDAEIKKRDEAKANAEKKARDAKKDDKAIESAKKAAEKNFTKRVTELQNRYNELSVYSKLAATDVQGARKVLPELKNLAKSRHAWLWHQAGGQKEADKLAKEAVDAGKNQVQPLVIQTLVFYETDRMDEAREAFQKLRTVAGHADLHTPLMQRLAPIAEELEWPVDWRTPAPVAKDIGKRPDLDSLGPFRWSPPAAPDFALANAKGEEFKLSDRTGRPTLVIFYLGKGCSHCMEQLNAFLPVKAKFAAAGIDILAISTDSPEGLADTFAASEEGEGSPFPFPLLSDEGLATFRKYRAFDDFEDQPLHGTFLIDGEQNIRWQDISFEPFMKTDWLLEECVRLLKFEG